MQKVTLDNFRSFKNQEFNFSKVNILIGENSGGKSSFLKFLLALKQTVLNKNINLKLYGDYVDLGNFHEVIYQNKTDEKLSFSFEFGKEYSDFYFHFIAGLVPNIEEEQKKIFLDDVRRYIGECTLHHTAVKFVLDKNLEKHESIKIEFSNKILGTLIIEHHEQLKIDNIDLNVLIAENPKCNLKYTSPEKEYFLEDIEFHPDTFMSRVLSNSLRKHCIDKHNDIGLFYKIAYFLVLQNHLTASLQKIRFINPIHSSPARFYTLRDETSYIHLNIERFINILVKSFDANGRNNILKLINDTLNNFGLADELDIRIDDKFSIAELRVRIKDLWSNITDVGYGVSLQLSIILQTMLSEFAGGEILLIEQPEVHLHPKLQASFIDTLLKIGPRNTYFIETHSESIIRKLQSIVKNKTHSNITKDDISIHYFRREKEKFTVNTHLINENGKLSPNLPSGFFDSSYLLAKELM